MMMPNRSYSATTGYRYGFNGKENDNEVRGDGNELDYGMRVYDTRLGRFLSVDPLYRDYPWNSDYAYAENSPISFIDIDGLEKKAATVTTAATTTTVVRTLTSTTIERSTEMAVDQGGKLIVKEGAKRSFGKWLGGIAGRGGGLFVGFMLSPLEANSGEDDWVRNKRREIELFKLREQQNPAPQPQPKPQYNPLKAPEPEEDDEEGYYIYETASSVKSSTGIVAKGETLPYYGITKNAVIGGRYHKDNERGKNFRGIIGKTNYYTAKGVESAIIELNMKGFDNVSSSTRVDNLIMSTTNRAQINSGILWLRKNYGENWQKRFLQPVNEKGPNHPDSKVKNHRPHS